MRLRSALIAFCCLSTTTVFFGQADAGAPTATSMPVPTCADLHLVPTPRECTAVTSIPIADLGFFVTALNSANRSSLAWLRGWCPVGILDETILLYHFSQPPATTPARQLPPEPAALCPGQWSYPAR